jgi:hypothetical protein
VEDQSIDSLRAVADRESKKIKNRNLRNKFMKIINFSSRLVRFTTDLRSDHDGRKNQIGIVENPIAFSWQRLARDYYADDADDDDDDDTEQRQENAGHEKGREKKLNYANRALRRWANKNEN